MTAQRPIVSMVAAGLCGEPDFSICKFFHFASIDEAIRLIQMEEAKVNENIHQLRRILLSMKAQPREASVEEVPKTDNEEGVLPEEREEIELLERVLQRAVRVRCKSGALRSPQTSGDGDVLKVDQPNRNVSTNQTSCKPVRKPSKDWLSSRRSASASRRSKGLEADQNACRDRGGMTKSSVRSQTAGRVRAVVPQGRGTGSQSAPVPATRGLHQPVASIVESRQMAANRDLHAEAPGTTLRQRPIEEPKPMRSLTSTSDSNALGNLEAGKGDGKPSVPPSVWRAHWAKHGRLWDKVLTAASKPVAERARFTERLLSTFPCEFPSSSPVDIRAEVERLTQLCQALTFCVQGEALAHKTGRHPGTDACWELEYESLLLQEGLEKLVLEVQRKVEKLKRDAEVWDRWGFKGSCPVLRRGRWGDPDLPPALTYTSEAELKELEGVRLRVAQLQQEIHLHQAMREAFSPCLTADCSALGGPSASVLRSLYSLLGEGGAQFPAVVLDTEPD
ncbi:hypothetical protein GJAV_G00221930 [Gymnothorax javanicus]|nr:hypothetical protein GJAV_G00221930 [Gymnothorax javanicus]